MKKTSRSINHRSPKHHKQHQQHKHSYLKTYWPYLPALLLMGWWLLAPVTMKLQANVLAYATNMSAGGLLQATNTQRQQNGATTLSLNSQLTQAAQAKANDMATRNYWSHNTPEGTQPWVFVQNAGYQYLKAGENLAYGFDSSDEAIVGWMNSPTHKANLLDTAFKEVGFGIANNADYQSNGNQTIVVAMYGNPYTPAPAAQPAACPEGHTGTPPNCSAPATAAAPATKPAVQNSATSGSSPDETEQPTAEPVVTPAPTSVPDTVTPTDLEINYEQLGYSTESTANGRTETNDKGISRLQALTGGQYPGINALLSGFIALALSLYVFKHVLAVRRVIVAGEQFVIKHPAFDVLLMFAVAVGLYLASQTGRIL